MLSVCIPVYNFDVVTLITELDKQRKLLPETVEIICIDDASEARYSATNATISNQCERFVQLPQNIGRSAIRNRFLGYANFDYLLFLDCDGIIIADDFLRKYIDCMVKEKKRVVSGGRVYGERPTDPKKVFRWKYGVKSEAYDTSSNAKEARKILLTNNFLIEKSILEKIRFDESLIGYGHEDTLFSYRLMQAGIDISYINNPVLDGDLETPDVFLEKTKEGIKNLYHISSTLKHSRDFMDMVPLLKTYAKIGQLSGLFAFCYRFISGLVGKNLNSSNPSIFAFNLYKLNALIQVAKKTKSL